MLHELCGLNAVPLTNLTQAELNEAAL